MKKIFFSLLIASSLIACSKQEGLQNLAATAFQTEIKSAEPGQILDVRTSDEYANGHIEGAVLADISSNLFQEAAGKLDKSKTVYVYCLSGGRSSAAATQLQEMGFTSIVNLSGGMLAWQSANLPTSTSEGVSAPAAGMTLADFDKLLQGKKLVIVDYNATWCGPCKQLSPVLEAWIKAQNGQVELIKIDVDANQELAKAKQIESIPYLEFYKDGKLADKQIGMGEAKAMTQKWKQILL
ncbi:MAG: Hydroxyacylglutathione hydrolase [Bacteroidota bacterium]|jgi:thioredoxin 1